MLPKPKNLLYFTVFVGLSLLGMGLIIGRQFFAKPPCANPLSCKESLELSVNNDEKAVFNGEKIDPPDINLADLSQEPAVLGVEAAEGEKHIYVDLTNQTLKAYQGDTLFLETKISSGKLYPTPTGDYKIWTKIRSTKMSGGSGSGYYYLPNVQYVMFFSNTEIPAGRGFSLHGTYWHNNFGHPMSHGCVNMRNIDAKKLYYWTNPYTAENKSAPATKDSPGTLITIYGKAP